MSIHPLFLVVWAVAFTVFGIWVGTASLYGQVASGRVHVAAHPVLQERAMGDYMCLKLHKPAKEQPHDN